MATVQSGERFGFLTAIEHMERRGNSEYWKVRCDCGMVKAVREYLLRNGTIQSCGCKKAELLSRANTKHGFNRKAKYGGPSREYMAWRNARNRCYNKRNRQYENYGGRGIRMATVWDDFAQFLADMGPCPEGMTLDRENNDGHYAPGNCRWATNSEQQNNRQSNVHFKWKGKVRTLAQIAELEAIPYDPFWYRVRKLHMTVRRAVNSARKLTEHS